MAAPPFFFQELSVPKTFSVVLLAFGGNLGDVPGTYAECIRQLAQTNEVESIVASKLHSTQPIGGPVGQPRYFNGAIQLRTSLQPLELLASIQTLESLLGRTRTERWGARTIDLDILLYSDQILHTECLELPHPRMTFRRFVLDPAVEVAADMVHPPTGWTIRKLREHLDESPFQVEFCGADRDVVEKCARWLAQESLATVSLLELAASPATDILPTASAAWAIQLVDRLNRYATASTAPGDSKGAVLADSLLEIKAWGRAVLNELDNARLRQSISALEARLPVPQLIVWLDNMASGDSGHQWELAAPRSWDSRSGMFTERIVQGLRAEMALRHRGPVLHLTACDESKIRNDLLAAWQAMRG